MYDVEGRGFAEAPIPTGVFVHKKDKLWCSREGLEGHHFPSSPILGEKSALHSSFQVFNG